LDTKKNKEKKGEEEIQKKMAAKMRSSASSSSSLLMSLCLFLAVLYCVTTTNFAKTVQLRVMNYNVRQLPVILGFNNWDQAERLKRLPAAMRKLQNNKAKFGEFSEVVFFNELMTSDAHWKIKEDLIDLWRFQTSVAGASCKNKHWDSIQGHCRLAARRSGVMAISSLEIQKRHAYIYSNYDGATWDKYANKGAVYITVMKEGHLFHLVGTHLQADEVGDEITAQAVRAKQMVELREWLKGFNIPRDEPVIIIGDLNVEWGYASAKIIEPDVYEFDFKNDKGFGSFSATTNWLARADVHFNKMDLNYDRTLDYIMAIKDYRLPDEPAWMDIYKLQSDDEWYWKYLNRDFDIPGEGKISKNGYYNETSDHWPVAATYKFNY